MGMMTIRDDATRERGGIPVRDYTQGDRSPSLMSRFQTGGVRNGLEKMNFDKVGRALGMFSLGLGLMQVLMPRRIQQLVGVRGDHTRLIRLAGVREIMHALLIYMQARPNQGVWTRVAGDAMDLALLRAALNSPRNDQNRVTMATAAVAGITALDVLTATLISRKRLEEKRYSVMTREDLNGRADGAFHVTKSITINRPAEVLYRFWRNFENLPQFMYHLESVQVMDERRSHWVAKAPAGTQVEWDAEITDDRPNELIAWRSTANAQVYNTGVVRFETAPAGRGTVVQVEIEYRPPGGAIGRAIAKLFGEEPGQQVAGDLRRFKQVIETGEVVLSEGSPQGFGQKLQRPARPMTADEMPDREGGWMSSTSPEQQGERAMER